MMPRMPQRFSRLFPHHWCPNNIGADPPPGAYNNPSRHRKKDVSIKENPVFVSAISPPRPYLLVMGAASAEPPPDLETTSARPTPPKFQQID
ncbi:hypothetical protein G3M48_000563 [Beauveria asiatica]|uniref:Uncharacterized protein n=1 Tax=Beauveria asiatica TaxID=1069075 RepID=A0AAW0RGN2_9HYPO